MKKVKSILALIALCFVLSACEGVSSLDEDTMDISMLEDASAAGDTEDHWQESGRPQF